MSAYDFDEAWDEEMEDEDWEDWDEGRREETDPDPWDPNKGNPPNNNSASDVKKIYDDIRKNLPKEMVEDAIKALEEGRPADSFGEAFAKATFGAMVPERIKQWWNDVSSAYTRDQIEDELTRAKMMELGYTEEQINEHTGTRSNFSAADAGREPTDSNDEGQSTGQPAPGQGQQEGQEGGEPPPDPMTQNNSEAYENYLLNKFMEIYNDPSVDMLELFGDYHQALDRGREIMMQSEGVTADYADEVEGLLNTPGVNLKMGGRQLTDEAGGNVSLQPLNTMRTHGDLMRGRYDARVDDLMRRGMAEQATGASKWDSYMQPLVGMHDSLRATRLGVPPSQEQYSPEWWERLAEVWLS
jgi:hypothetical protein